MSTIIDKLKDKFGNFVLPITNTKAIYDDDGNRLDNVLARLDKTVELYDNPTITMKDSILNVLSDKENYNFPLDFAMSCQEGWFYVSLIKTGTSAILTGTARNLERDDVRNIVINIASNSFQSTSETNTVSDLWNWSKNYSAGQYCIYNNTLWKSKVSNNLGNTPPNETYWTPTSVAKNLITTDGDGNYGYYKADDSFSPFRSTNKYFTIFQTRGVYWSLVRDTEATNRNWENNLYYEALYKSGGSYRGACCVYNTTPLNLTKFDYVGLNNAYQSDGNSGNDHIKINFSDSPISTPQKDGVEVTRGSTIEILTNAINVSDLKNVYVNITHYTTNSANTRHFGTVFFGHYK